MNVGLVGVGAVGARMAAQLLAAGHAVWARDTAPEAEARARALGCRVATDAVYLLNHTELILICLPLGADVTEVMEKLLRAAPRGLVIMDMTTVDCAAAQGHMERAQAAGVAYLAGGADR